MRRGSRRRLGTLLTWTYDNENRCLNELRPSGANHTYTYQSDGLRWSAHQGGAANAYTFIWDGQDLLNEYVNGALSTRYAVLDGEVLARKQGASRYVFVPDPLGSVHHLLDSSLNKAATMAYWPYGERESLTGVELPAQFVGALGYYTAAQNRVYVRARWYRSDFGRWQTVDPIGFDSGDWNLYAYAAMQPVSATDPDGLLPFQSSCGPDITAHLARTLQAVRDRWAALEQGARFRLCESLISLVALPPNEALVCQNAWDINQLHKAPENGRDGWWMNKLPPPCCQPRPPCEDTVVVAGECHRGYSVNYVVFGLMWKLCGRWRNAMYPLIAANKCQHAFREAMGAFEWASAGLDGWPRAVTPSSALTDRCPNRCRAKHTDPFQVHWGYPDDPWFVEVPPA